MKPDRQELIYWVERMLASEEYDTYDKVADCDYASEKVDEWLEKFAQYSVREYNLSRYMEFK